MKNVTEMPKRRKGTMRCMGVKRERDTKDDVNQGRLDPQDEIDIDILEQMEIIDESPNELNICEIIVGKESTPYDFDPYVWEVSMMEDMCEKEKYGNADYDQVYFDGNSWEALDPKFVKIGETEEMSRFKRQQVYGYCLREEAINDREGKFVKV